MLHPGVPLMWYGHIRDLFPTAEGCMGSRLPNATMLHWAQQRYGDEDEMFMLTSVNGKVIDYETANRYSALPSKELEIEQVDEGVTVPCENPLQRP